MPDAVVDVVAVSARRRQRLLRAAHERRRQLTPRRVLHVHRLLPSGDARRQFPLRGGVRDRDVVANPRGHVLG